MSWWRATALILDLHGEEDTRWFRYEAPNEAEAERIAERWVNTVLERRGYKVDVLEIDQIA